MHEFDSPQSPIATDPHPATYNLPDGKEIMVWMEHIVCNVVTWFGVFLSLMTCYIS